MTQQNSANLALPYIQPAQAQKHVTHNEAIRLLDALVQAVVEEPPRNTPPAAAAEGSRYLVGPAPSDGWAGQANAIAWRTDGAWTFLAPRTGWVVRVASDGGARVWRSGEWQTDGLPEVVESLGFNTSADSTNRLSVSAEATLLSHEGGSHRLKVNKAVATETASVLFQVGFQGRAEMGLTGTNNYEVKTSTDGATWQTGLRISSLTGVTSFPSGVAAPQRVDLGGALTVTDGTWVGLAAGAGAAGSGAEPDLNHAHTGPLIPAGARLTDLAGAFRRGHAEVTGIDLRLFFQTGPWTGTWDSDAETTRTVLHATDGLALSQAWAQASADLGGWIAPDDGFLLAFLRPAGTLTAPRELQAILRAGYLTAA